MHHLYPIIFIIAHIISIWYGVFFDVTYHLVSGEISYFLNKSFLTSHDMHYPYLKRGWGLALLQAGRIPDLYTRLWNRRPCQDAEFVFDCH
jgi:hypothetical protein